MPQDCPVAAVAMQVSAHEGIWETMLAMSWAATEVAAATAAMRASEKRMVMNFFLEERGLTWLWRLGLRGEIEVEIVF